jgi:hypothetical protein
MDKNNNSLQIEDELEHLTAENVESELARMKLIDTNYNSDDETRVKKNLISVKI